MVSPSHGLSTNSRRYDSEIRDGHLGIQVLRNAGNDIEDNVRPIDIVAIHGIGAHPIHSWTYWNSETGVASNWLQDEAMLSRDLPHARIMIFGYRSEWTGSQALNVTISEVANSLLHCLAEARQGLQSRPVMFIAHCAGGLVLMRALSVAYQARTISGEPHDMLNMIIGIIFLGTPFRGARGSLIDGRILAAAQQRIDAIPDANERHESQTIKRILEILEPGNEALSNILEDFLRTGCTDTPQMVCFYETRPANVWRIVRQDRDKEMLVPKCCATIDRILALPLDTDHFGLNKFEDRNTQAYRGVVGKLREFDSGLQNSQPSTTNSTNEPAKHEPEEERRNQIKSLKFERIENRYSNIKPAHHKTCQWLQHSSKYASWLDKSQISTHNGIMWLKGKPGSGKSTIMKSVVSEAENSRNNDIHAYFFFNARGSWLEKDTLGMYRSLLFQLFEKLPQAGVDGAFKHIGLLDLPQKPTYSWTIPQLQNLLRHTIRQVRRSWLWIYIDALDECDEDSIRDMVVYFEFLGGDALASGINMRIFFASRHYPHITIARKIEMRLEDEREHSLDIQRFIHCELNDHLPELPKLREQVMQRASGVFIWAVLAVRVLNKAYDHGELSLGRKLYEIPGDLTELFREMLTRDSENVKAMQLCIQWILLAKRPLSREELYYAIHSGMDQEHIGPRERADITPEIMDKFILSCSKGLAEITQPKGETVQFIHETVRDFFLTQNGLQYIQVEGIPSRIGQSHDILRECCINSILSTPNDEARQWPSGPTERLLQRNPFTKYAVLHVLFHANAAEFYGVPQDAFLRDFAVRAWISATEEFYYGVTYPLNSSLLYILANQDYSSLIKAVFRIYPNFVFGQDGGPSPLQTALQLRHYNALCALLTPSHANGVGTHPDAEHVRRSVPKLLHNYSARSNAGSTDLSIIRFFFRCGTEANILALLCSGRIDLSTDITGSAGSDALSLVARRGYGQAAQILLQQAELDANRRDMHGRTPLSIAAGEGGSSVVRALLGHAGRVDVNSQSSDGRTALSYAAAAGHEDIVRLLLDCPLVLVNLRDDRGRPPFYHAVRYGRRVVTELLIHNENVDIATLDDIGQTPLFYAAVHGHEDIVRLLLSCPRRTDVIRHINARDRVNGRTPLAIATLFPFGSVDDLLRRAGGER